VLYICYFLGTIVYNYTNQPKAILNPSRGDKNRTAEDDKSITFQQSVYYIFRALRRPKSAKPPRKE